MEIYFIRHPKTIAPEGICYGQADLLPGEGELQKVLDTVNAKLSIPTNATFYSSPLQRCDLLGRALANGKTITHDARLKEINFGTWEMIPWNGIPKDEQEAWSEDLLNSKPHGGESLNEMTSRVRSFWDEIITIDNETVVVTCHAGTLYSLLMILLEASPQKVHAMDIQYGEILRVSVSTPEYYKLRFL